MNKNINKITQLICLLFLCSCQNKKQVVKTFEKVFEGKIDKRYILLKMRSDSGVISGSYFYTQTGGELRLQGAIDLNDSLIVNEYVYNKPGEITGIFKGCLTNNGTKFYGNWEGKDTIYKFNLQAAQLNYEKERDTIKKTLLPKEKPVDLTGFEGATTLTSKTEGLIHGGNSTCFSVNYSKYKNNIKSVYIYVTIDDKNIKKVNDKIRGLLEKVENATNNVSKADKKILILHNILKEMNKDEFFDISEGANSMINIYTVCLGSKNEWKKREDSQTAFINSFENKTSPWFSTQIQRENLPQNGFDICFENPVLMTSVKFEVKIIGIIDSGKNTKLVNLSNMCNK